MIFSALSESADRGELILTYGGLLRYHQRKDGTVTILEILVLPRERRQGCGSRMVIEVTRRVGADKPLVAKCPADLPANEFWLKQGFKLERVETLKSGKPINVWRRAPLRSSSSIVPMATASSPPPP